LRQFQGVTRLAGGSLNVSRPAQWIGGLLTGTGSITGTVTNRAVIQPGLGLGQLTINGIYVQESNGVLEIELGGNQVGTNADRLAVSSTLTLGGTVRVSLVNGFVPAPGDPL
jgi:hypothetical protein